MTSPRPGALATALLVPLCMSGVAIFYLLRPMTGTVLGLGRDFWIGAIEGIIAGICIGVAILVTRKQRQLTST